MTDQATSNEIANWNAATTNYRLSADNTEITFLSSENRTLPPKNNSIPANQTFFEFGDLLEGAPNNPVTPVAFADMAAVVAWIKPRTGFSGVGGAGQAGFNPNFVFTGAGTDANDFGPAETARDAYFTTNPDERTTGTVIVVVNTFPTPNVAEEQLWDGSAWTNTNTVLSPQQISDLLYSLPDRNPLTDARAATVDAITSTGRGQIITAAEATEIDNSFSNAVIADNIITFTQNDTTTEAVTLPRGMLQYADVPVNADVTISTGNLSTYQNRTVVITGANVTITFDTLANFIAATSPEFFITFLNEQSTSGSVTAGTGNTITGRTSVSLSQGESITIKYPGSGTVWGVIAAPATTPITPLVPPGGGNGNDEIPDFVARFVRDESDNVVTWDASSGSFPADSDVGFWYPVSVAGTVDNVEFQVHDSIIAIVDEASTTIFENNWIVIRGDRNVISWGGFQGIVDDSEIIRKLRTLGFENVATLTNLALTDIASRIDTTTSLVGDHVITFDITSVRSLSTLVLNLNDTLIHTFTVSSLTDGTNTQTINISSSEWTDIVITPNLTTLPFQLSGTTAEGTTVTSNTVNVERRSATQEEFFYYGRAGSAADPTTIDITTLTSVELGSVVGQEITFTIPTGNVNDKIILLAPAIRPITALVNTATGFPVLSSFTTVLNDRIINSENFNSYELDALLAAFTASYRATL